MHERTTTALLLTILALVTLPSLTLPGVTPSVATPSVAASVPRPLMAGAPVLVARGNITDGFRLPAGTSLSSSTVDLADDGHVAIDGLLSAGAPALFVGTVDSGGVVYQAPDGSIMSDVDLGTGGDAVFSLSFTAPEGVYRYDAGTGTGGFLTNRPLGASSWTSAQENALGTVGFRAGFPAGRAYVLFENGVDQVLATEASIDLASPYSFLFTPALDPIAGRIAGKVRLGESGQVSDDRPDEIRIFGVGDSTLVVTDRDADPGSPFIRFDNGVSIARDAARGPAATTHVAFVAELDGGVRGVFVSDGDTVTTIARDDGPETSEVLFFATAVNADGLVAFRGRDADGLEAVFVGDGVSLVRVIGEHDLVTTDRGTGRLDQHDSSPIFGGGVAIDDTGRIAFVAGLTPPDDDQVEWGSGVFVVPVDGTLFADGFESGDTTAWSAVVP